MIDISYKLRENKVADINGLKVPMEYLIYDDYLVNDIKKYETIEKVDDELYKVKLNEKYGLIDKIGKEIVHCVCDCIYLCEDGLVIIKVDNRSYLIELKNKKFISNPYDKIFPFVSDLIKVILNEKCGLIDKTGKEIVPCVYNSIEHFNFDLYIVDINGKYGLIDKNGKEKTQCIYDSIQYSKFGLYIVEVNGKYGLMDRMGNEILLCKYDAVCPFDFNLYAVKIDRKYKMIDKNGKEKTEFRGFKYNYSYIYPTNFDLYIVKDWLEEYYGLIDETGKEILPCHYKSIYPISSSVYVYKSVDIMCGDDNKYEYSLVNKYGEHNWKEYEEIVPFTDYLAKCKDKYGRRYGLIDNRGYEIIPCECDEICIFNDKLIKIKKNGKYGLIDRMGYEIIPCEYDDLFLINNNLIRFKLYGKYGLINKRNKVIVWINYEEITSFDDDFLRVKKNGKYGLIDKTGKEIIPCIYAYDDLTKTISIMNIKETKKEQLFSKIALKETLITSTYSLDVKIDDKTTTYELKSIEEANMIIDYLNEIVYSYEDKISIIEKQASKNIQKVLKIK